MPALHSRAICHYHESNGQLVEDAINGSLKAKQQWECMPFADRAAVFLKAADLLASPKYRYRVMAATMLGQGKNSWQAEVDAAAELCDFWRFNCAFAEEIYAQQPARHAEAVWNRVEYRPLEGFILAISPFNFTAIGGNLTSAPALMGNTVVWKPSSSSIYSNYIIYQILEEAGLPPGVIQFLPGQPDTVVQACLKSPDFAGLHFTGSTAVFQQLWQKISQNLPNYRSYPRIVGETGGKNMHFVHESADLSTVVNQTIRGAFEYQGQKCSATSRLIVPDCMWPEIKPELLNRMKLVTQARNPTDLITSFTGPVINEAAFKKITGYIQYARERPEEAEVLCGGGSDSTKGYFIEPTIIQCKSMSFKTMREEIFGPVLSVYVYPRDKYEETLREANESSAYALTGSIFARDRAAINQASEILRHSAGNFYINDKSTGAVVGQQPFGGSRLSGTNDKAGSALNLYRWISMRTIKENFLPLNDFRYPSNF